MCDFSFAERYGPRGAGFIEAHHDVVPVSTLESGARIKPSDLVLVCANCHRMLHRQKPWLKASELRDRLGQIGS